MCTLSFVATRGGFLLAMNRDEQLTRARALPPSVHRCGDLKALYPSEPAGGTWIGINGAGLCLALLNWYARPQLKETPAFSRGEIIPELLSRSSPEEADEALLAMPLHRLQPFRLFIIGSENDGIREYRSDGSCTERTEHPRMISHWFSSGRDELSASAVREKTCRDAATEEDAGNLTWLKRLHSSHQPKAGANSICVHRDDARTVSLTLIEYSGKNASMSYHDGPPCLSLKEKAHLSRLTINGAV